MTATMQLPPGVLATLAVLLSVVLARAGDPIQFSDDKAKPAPNAKPVDSEVFKSWDKAKPSVGSPLNSLTPFITSGRTLDVKEDKRLKNERLEKKNWMLLEPGELQKRDDEEEAKFGGKAYSIDSIDDDSTANYLFHGLGDSKSERAKNNRAGAEADENVKKENRRSLSIFGPRETDQQGAHTSTELNLKGLIDPSQVNGGFNKNEATLFQFLKENSLPAPDKAQQARTESFREFINGPQPNTPSGISDPINFRTDLTQERMNPILPNRPTFELAPAAKAPDAFTAKPAFGGGFTPGRAPGLPEMGTAGPRQPLTGGSLPSPFLTPNDAPKTPRATVGGGNNSLFGREAPRRGGL